MFFNSKNKKEDREKRKEKKADYKPVISNNKDYEREHSSFAETGVPGEKIDLISGAVYKESKPIKKYPKENVEISGNENNSTFQSIFGRPPISKPVTVIKRKPVVKGNLLVICIELSYQESQIENIINLFINQEKPKFLKVILFKNGIYSTAAKFHTDFAKDEILNFIKIKKEAVETLKETMSNNNILLFDAIGEAITFEEKINYFGKRVVNECEYIANEVRYVFVISGEEKGSKTSKEQLQEMLLELRQKNANLHAVLTNFSNLPVVSSWGFRSIVTINL